MQGVQVDDFGFDVVFCQFVGCFQSMCYVDVEVDDGYVFVGMCDVGFVEGNGEIFEVWYVEVVVIQDFVFKEDYWVVVVDCGFQQVFGIGCGIGYYDFQVGDCCILCCVILIVLCVYVGGGIVWVVEYYWCIYLVV